MTLKKLLKNWVLRKAGSLLGLSKHFPTLSPLHIVTLAEEVEPEKVSDTCARPRGGSMQAQ